VALSPGASEGGGNREKRILGRESYYRKSLGPRPPIGRKRGYLPLKKTLLKIMGKEKGGAYGEAV